MTYEQFANTVTVIEQDSLRRAGHITKIKRVKYDRH
jgi:hypothetical protein